MVSYPGVKKVYKDSEELQNWFKRIFSLALIRKIDFLDELDTIINRKGSHLDGIYFQENISL